MLTNVPPRSLVDTALEHRADARVEDTTGTHTLGAILEGGGRLVRSIGRDLRGERVLLQGSASAAWAQAFFGLVAAGAVVVPVASTSTRAELDTFARDAGARLAIVTHEADAPFPEGVELVRAPALLGEGEGAAPVVIDPRDTAMMLYTSGTTGAPKGARLTHANLAAQTAILREAWRMERSDVLLHALPMHHLHGIVVAFLTTLFTPARVIARSKFTPEGVLDAMDRATVFMAVPTMYARIVETFDRAPASDRDRWSASMRSLRLLTSGSAALPASLAERVRAIAGVLPLERYGMTEIGMALSNSIDPVIRRPGRVGGPLPTVEVRIIAEDGTEGDGPGELWVKGPSVFAGYHGREDETRASFRGEWFLTGDVAERDASGSVRLLGRSSVDILKSGGEKLSALEIEEVLREHPGVADVAVIGVPDETWGDRVVAVIVPRGAVDPTELRAWMRERVAPFKVPKEFRMVEALPRNAMGKVQKSLLRA